MVERVALVDGAEQTPENVLGKSLTHHRAREHIAAVQRVHGLELGT
jgi:hypothetical protein